MDHNNNQQPTTPQEAQVNEQRSAAWYEEKKYKFSSSSIWKLLTEPRTKEAKALGELSETAKTYVIEKIAEELGGSIPEMSAKQMEWGLEYEPLAKEWYTRLTGNQIVECGFCLYTEFYGGSPDGKVLAMEQGKDGIWKFKDTEAEGAIEVKCPYNSANHIWHCTIKSQEQFKKEFKEYYWQCVSNMIVLGVKWCDFVSFDPRIDGELGFFKFRLTLLDEDKEAILLAIDRALEYKRYVKEVLLCVP